MKKHKLLIALALLAVVALYFLNNPMSFAVRFQTLALTHGAGYYHHWFFSGVTTKEYVETGYSLNLPVSSKLTTDGVNTVSIATVAHISSELVKKFAEEGVTVTILSVQPKPRIIQTTETRQYKDYTVYTIRSKLAIDCDVEFKTDQAIDDGKTASLAVWAAWIFLTILDHIGTIIITAAIGLTIYVFFTTVANSFSTTQSTIETEYYDENGNLIRKTKQTQLGTDWSAVLPQIAVILVAGAVAAYSMKLYMGRKRQE